VQKPDIRKIAVREAAIMASCVATAFGIGRLIPGIRKGVISLKLAAMLYLASIAFRVAGLFIRMTFAVALVLGMVGIALLILAARYPAAFSFLK